MEKMITFIHSGRRSLLIIFGFGLGTVSVTVTSVVLEVDGFMKLSSVRSVVLSRVVSLSFLVADSVVCVAVENAYVTINIV